MARGLSHPRPLRGRLPPARRRRRHRRRRRRSCSSSAPGPKPGPPWSSWQPPTGLDRLARVRDRAARRQRLPARRAATRWSGSRSAAAEREQLRRRRDRQEGRSASSLDKSFDPESTAVFILCGDNPSTCAITQGQPSIARGTVASPRGARARALHDGVRPPDRQRAHLLPAGQRREEAELDASSSAAASSPAASSTRSAARCRRRTPPLPGKIVPREEKTVNDLTASALYNYLGIAQNVIVIQPPVEQRAPS